MAHSCERNAERLSFERARYELGQRVPALLDALGLRTVGLGSQRFVQPGGGSPASGRNSFCVFTNTGTFKDFAGGTGGDMIALIGLCRRLEPIEALKWAYDWLGWGGGGARENPAEIARLRKIREAEATRAEAKARERGKRMVGYWATLPPGKGTLVEAYLRYRGIRPEAFGGVPPALRFEPRALHVDAAGVETHWPAMVAPIFRDNVPLGIHRTYLDFRTSGKAPVSPAKKMFGSARGGVVRLVPGSSGLKHAAATAQAASGHREPLLIGEGIETVLSIAACVPEIRAWAALSLGNLDLPWPAAYVDRVLIAADNDLKPQAVSQFERIVAAWEGRARPRDARVSVIRADPEFNDFNDQLRAEA